MNFYLKGFPFTKIEKAKVILINDDYKIVINYFCPSTENKSMSKF